MCVAEQHALTRQSIEIRGSSDIIDPTRTVNFCIDLGVPTPIVGEQEQDIGPTHVGPRRWGARKAAGQHGEQQDNSGHGHGSSVYAESCCSQSE